mmetsp:Transcript_20196/g.47429  ORF Transcript_20196/g.47429 Transcript_20196/m.47429 type:complete len:531 (+) Transcript_20196:49-1641(+)
MKISTLSTLLSTLILGLSSKTSSVEAFDCGTFESKMVISVDTDEYAFETEWVLEKDDGMGGWIEEESNDLPSRSTLYVDRVCLDPNTKYRWTITDTYGDGLYGNTNPIEIKVNGDVIFEDPLVGWSILELTFITPGNPETGSVTILTESPSSSPSSFPSVSSAPSTSVIPSSMPSISSIPSSMPSISSIPSASPTALMCMGDESKLNVYVFTDNLPSETSWILEILDMGSWVTVESNPLDTSRTQYYDAYCLEADSTYRWTITDTYGDGIWGLDPFSLSVNGEEIFSEPTNYWMSLEIRFITPSDPSGPVLILTDSPSDSPSDSPTASLRPSSSPTASSMPSSSPTVFFCDNEEDDILSIEVTTDYYYYRTTWYLYNQEFETIATSSFSSSYTLYVDNFCLIPGRSYLWRMTDYVLYNRRGNGLDCDPGKCGYSVKLNGEEIVENGKFFDKVEKEIGPVECVEEPEFHRVVNPKPGRNKFKRVYCNGVRKLLRETGDSSVCSLPLIDGSGYLYDKCKRSCGSVGLGPCAE